MMRETNELRNGVAEISGRERVVLLRRHALHCKYEKAVSLYADTDLTMKDIASQCGVTTGGLGSYLRRYWRELVLRRHHIPAEGKDLHSFKIIATGKQNINAHAKYKDAIAACDSMNYIDLNISQVARKFGVNGPALANFMRIHYPDTLIQREEVRRQLGINDNIRHGVRPESTAQYAAAVELYRNTDMTMHEIAEMCKVSEGGFSQHLRFYHKELLRQKRQRRLTAKGGGETYGALLGNGRKNRPSATTEQKYAEALAMYKDTALTMKEIVRRTGVPAEGFRFYLHKWHKDLVLQRSGISAEADGRTDLRKARKRMKTAAAKYEKAIESLRTSPRPLSEVAAEFGLHPEVFRGYLHKHEPELAARLGMVRARNGKTVLRRSEEKYAEAIRIYETTAESLKSISKRLGLTYNSIRGYISRNYPEAVSSHRTLLEQQELSFN